MRQKLKISQAWNCNFLRLSGSLNKTGPFLLIEAHETDIFWQFKGPAISFMPALGLRSWAGGLGPRVHLREKLRPSKRGGHRQMVWWIRVMNIDTFLYIFRFDKIIKLVLANTFNRMFLWISKFQKIERNKTISRAWDEGQMFANRKWSKSLKMNSLFHLDISI